ncbi:hypothetical protein MKX03_034159, partial [Papaver bracteatum]
ISSKKSGGVVKTFSGRKRIAVEGEKALGGGEILDEKKIIEEGTSSQDIDSEKRPAKKEKIPLKKKDSKSNEGEVISQSTKGRKFRANFTPIWSLINRIYKKEKLSFSEEQLGMIHNSPFGYIFMMFHETRNTKEHPCKTHSTNHWTKMPKACNKVLKWYVRGPGKKEHYFVFTHRGNEYKLRSTSEQLTVIFRMPQIEGRGKERNLTKWDKSYSQSDIVGLVKSGEKNEDLVKLIGLFMCETLFFTAHSGSQLNKKYLKLFDSPWKTNILSYGVKETQIAEGLPRFSRWNFHDIYSDILTNFESLEISEGFIEAYTEVVKQTLNSLRMRIHQQDQLLFCKTGEGQPQQNEIIMQEEVRSTVQGDKGVGNIDQEQLLIQQNKYDDLRMSIKRRWDAKENQKLNEKTVHYEVEELLNDFHFKAYPDEKKRKIKKQRKVKFVSAIFK